MADVNLYPGEANKYDVRLGRALTINDSVTGSAAATGSIVETWGYGDAVTGSAAASGSNVDAFTASDVVSGQAYPTGSAWASSTAIPVAVVWLSGRRNLGGSVIRVAPMVSSLQGSKTGADSPSGSAAATGSVVEARVGSDLVSGSAAPSGSIVEAVSVLALSQMTIAVRRAVDLRKRYARVRYQHRLTSGAGVTVLTDVVTGSASPSGSVVEAWSVLSLQQMTIRAYRAIDLLKRRIRVRYQHRLTLNAGITTTTDAPTGSASPAGSVVEAKIGADAVSGSSAPTGTIVESSSVLTLQQMTIRLVRASDLLKRYAHVRYVRRLTYSVGITTISDAPSGFASPSGSIVESKTGSDTDSGTASPSGASTDLLSHASAPSGTASASGTDSELRIGSDAVTGAANASGSISDAGTGGDSVSGVAGATGALVELRIGTDAVTGAAQPSGSVVENEFRGFADSPSGSAAPSGTATEAATYRQDLSGAASPSGALVDDYQPPIPEGPVGGVGGVPEGVRLSRLTKEQAKPRLYLDNVNGYAGPIGYVTETCIVMPRIAWVDSEEDELMLLGLL